MIKFSGDALTIYFQAVRKKRCLFSWHVSQAVDDTKHEKYNHVVPPHGTWGAGAQTSLESARLQGLPDRGPQDTAVLRVGTAVTRVLVPGLCLLHRDSQAAPHVRHRCGPSAPVLAHRCGMWRSQHPPGAQSLEPSTKLFTGGWTTTTRDARATPGVRSLHACFDASPCSSVDP